MDAGRPCTAVAPIAADAGIVSYEPGDLTLTARAGTSLAEIERATAAQGQWLTLDPFGPRTGTIGATVATASWGPLASAFGTPRDHVLGCEFVTGAGNVVNAGGRVVKNVAGFDLVRLATGAWGTVGVLTEVTLRLRSRPEVDESFAIVCPSATRAVQWLRSSSHTPLAAELLSPALAKLLLGEATDVLLVRFGGNARLVSGSMTDAAVLGDPKPVGSQVWHTLANIEPKGASVFRLSTVGSRVATLWERTVPHVEAMGGFAHATLNRGVVRCIVPAAGGGQPFSAALTEGVTMVGERLADAAWASARSGRSTHALEQRVRLAFDPDGLLNPGILGDA